MGAFFQLRLRRHLTKMLKYLRYVFNDHFVLVLMFLFGGLAFYYSQLLRELPAVFPGGRLLLLAVWLLALLPGKLATLLVPADLVFLLPKEAQMKSYLNRALAYSSGLPLFFSLFVAVITLPLALLATGYGLVDGWWLGGTLLFLKEAQLILQACRAFEEAKAHTLVWWGSTVVILLLAFYLSPLAACLLALAGLLALGWHWHQLSGRLRWELLVEAEQKRQHRIYRFINLFTDVPEIIPSVSRRRFLDPLFRGIKPLQQNTYLYLYARSFVRGSEYSGLYLRLLLVGAVILWFLADFYWALGFSLLFLYLIGFQLLPLYQQFDYMVLTRLYPIRDTQKQKTMQQLLTVLLASGSLFFGLIAVVQLSVAAGAMIFAASLAFSLLFSFLYVPNRLKKMQG